MLRVESEGIRVVGWEEYNNLDNKTGLNSFCDKRGRIKW